MTKQSATIIFVIFTLIFLAKDALADIPKMEYQTLSDIELSTYSIDQAGYLSMQGSLFEFIMRSSSGAVMEMPSLKVSLAEDDGYAYPELTDVSDYFRIDAVNQRLYVEQGSLDKFDALLNDYFTRFNTLTLLLEATDSYDRLIYTAISFRSSPVSNHHIIPTARRYYAIEPNYEGC